MGFRTADRPGRGARPLPHRSAWPARTSRSSRRRPRACAPGAPHRSRHRSRSCCCCRPHGAWRTGSRRCASGGSRQRTQSGARAIAHRRAWESGRGCAPAGRTAYAGGTAAPPDRSRRRRGAGSRSIHCRRACRSAAARSAA